MVRAPRLPFDEYAALTDLSEALARVEGDTEHLATAIASDYGRAYDRLRRLATQADVNHIVRNSSPALAIAFDRSQPRGGRRSAADARLSLLRYVARLAGRSTPYGLLAGYGVVRQGEATRLWRAPAAAAQHYHTVEASSLAALVGALERDSRFGPHLRYRWHSGVYRSGDEFCLAVGEPDGSRRVVFDQRRIGPHPWLDAVRHAMGADGCWPLSEIRRCVQRCAGCGNQDAAKVVEQLVAHGLLVSEIHESGPARFRLGQVASVLRRIVPEHPLCADVQAVEDGLASADGPVLSAHRDNGAWLGSWRRLSTLAGVELSTSVDMELRFGESTLRREVFRDILRGATIRRQLSVQGMSPSWQRFCRDFYERYGERDVPLGELLDPERGLGFRPGLEAAPEGAVRLDSLLQGVCPVCGPDGVPEIQLDHADIARLAGAGAAELPDAFVAWAQVAMDCASPTSDAYTVLLRGCRGPSAIWAFARFAVHDPKLVRNLEALAEAEQALQPEAVLVDLAYAPSGAAAGVLRRPTLRAYEIEYHGRSVHPETHRLPVDDLLVRVRGERISLWSRRLGRRLRLRPATAHAASDADPPIYRFLRALEHAEDGTQGFVPPQPAPRLRVGRILLSEATWCIPERDFRTLREADDVDRFRTIQSLRSKLSIPRWVSVGFADQWLPVDLGHILGCDMLVRELARSPSRIIRELFPSPDRLLLQDGTRSYVHELMVPFVRSPPKSKVGAVAQELQDASDPLDPRPVDRHVPGDEWLSMHLYGAPAVIDRLIRETVSPLVEADGGPQAFFFLRYGQPTFHARVRCSGDPRWLLGDFYLAFAERVRPLVRRGLIWRVELATYDRETVRYGGVQGVRAAEAVFHQDSLEALEQIRRDPGGETRWHSAVHDCHRMVTRFFPEPLDAIQVVQPLRDYAFAKVGGGKQLVGELSMGFRRQRAALSGLLQEADACPEPLEWGPRVDTLRLLSQRRKLGRDLRAIVGSFVHLAINRRIVQEHLHAELALTDALLRFYRSRAYVGQRP